MVAGLGRAVYIIEIDPVVCLKEILVQRGVGRCIQHRHLAVDGVHPARPFAVRRITCVQAAACGVGHTGHIIAGACVSVAVGGQHGFQCVPCRLIGIALAGIGCSCQIGEGRCKGAAGHVHSDSDILNRRVLETGSSDHGDDRTHRLLVELLELRIGRIRTELLVILAIFDISQNAVNLDMRVVLRLRDRQLLVRDHTGNAGTEAAVLLGVVPAVDIIHLHAEPLGFGRGAEELVTVTVRDDLHERPQIAGNVIARGIGLADALPVDVLGADLLHKGRSCIDLGLGHSRDGDLDLLACKDPHVVIVLAGTAGAGQDLDGQRNLGIFLTGQRPVDPRAGSIGFEGLHDRFIAAGDQDRGVFSVKVCAIIVSKDAAHIRGGGEMDVGGDVVHVNLRTGCGDIECAVGVLRAAGQPEFQTFLIVDSLLGALDRYSVGKVDLQIVAATVGQSGGERHACIRLRAADLHGVWCVELGGITANADHRGVRGLPCDLGPQMQIIGRIVVHIILVYSLFDHVVRNGCKRRAVVQFLRDDDATALHAQRFECPVLVQTDDDGRALHLIGVAVTGEDQRGIAVQVSRGGRAVVVPLIMQRAVKIDAGTRVREQILFGNSALHRNGDTLNVTGSQAGLRHSQKILVRLEVGLIVFAQKRLCGFQLFTGSRFRIGHVLGPASIEVKVLAVLAAVHIVIFPIVPLAVAPFAQEFRAVGIFHLAIDAGAGGPARERVAFAHQRAGRKLDLLIEGGALVFHAARHAAVNGAGMVANDVAAAVPLRLERHAAFAVGTEVIRSRHAVAQRAVRQHDVPVVIFLSGGEFGAVQRRKRHMAVFVDGGVRNGFLIAVAVEMDGQAGLLGFPERVERGVRRQFDCRTIVIDLFARG